MATDQVYNKDYIDALPGPNTAWIYIACYTAAAGFGIDTLVPMVNTKYSGGDNGPIGTMNSDPLIIGAGGQVILPADQGIPLNAVNFLADASADLHGMVVEVYNAAGTQYLSFRMQSSNVLVLTRAADLILADLRDFVAFAAPIGSDLSLDPATGAVVSAAGGTYFVSVWINPTYSGGGPGAGGPVTSVDGRTGDVDLSDLYGAVESIDSDGTIVVGGSIQVPRLSLGDISFIYALNTFLTSQVNPTVYTAATAPTAGKLNQYDCTSGALAPTIPLASSVLAGETVGFKKIDSSANFLTATCSGSDHIDISTGSTTIVTKTQNQFVWLTSDGVSVWTKTGGDFSLASLDLRFQPLDSDLTAIAALSTTSFGRAVLALADAAALRTAAGLGTLATQSGTFSGTSSGTNTGDQTLPVGGTPAVVLGAAAAAGTSPNFLRRDDTIAAFDATVPSTQAYGDAAATGSAVVAARRDHKHAMPATTKDTTAVTGALKGNGSTVTSSTDLTAIDGLSPSNDDVIQRKAGAWTNRTMAQVATDLESAAFDVRYVRFGNGKMSGAWYGPSFGLTAGMINTTQTLNLAYAVPFFSPGATYDRMAVQQNSGSTAGELVRLGIFSDNGSGYPGALLLDAGTVSVATGGGVAATISQAVPIGLCWLVAVHTVSVTNLLIGVSSQINGGNQLWLPSSLAATVPAFGGLIGFTQSGVSGALPSNWTATPTGVSTVPQIWMRAA